MRAVVGYLIGAAVSLTGGVADLAYINVSLVPRMMEAARPIAEPIVAEVSHSVSPDPSVEIDPPEIEEAVEPPPPAPPEIVYRLAATVRFKTSSDVIDDRDRAEIGAVATELLEDPELVARTDGYADERGPAAYNQDLSDRRAAAVVRELERRGVDVSRIERRAFGERRTTEKWSLDRRVEISVGGPAK